MPRIQYVTKNFKAGALDLIEKGNEIIEDYAGQGYTLTLRQLYYQFVARDLIANKQTEYKRLGGVINDGRLAGLIDWDAIEDRTRGLESLAHWGSPENLVEACAEQFRIDRWRLQPSRVEVWVEKEALAGIFSEVCERWDVPYLSCRGYTSQSEMWRAAMRLKGVREARSGRPHSTLRRPRSVGHRHDPRHQKQARHLRLRPDRDAPRAQYGSGAPLQPAAEPREAH